MSEILLEIFNWVFSKDGIAVLTTSGSIISLVYVKGRILLRKLEGLEGTLEYVEKELKPNSGGSIKDIVNDVKKSVQAIESTHMDTQKLISLALDKLDQRQRIMLNDHECGIFETDADGLCVWINKRYSELTGRSFDEMRGYGWTATIHDEDRERIQENWNSAMHSHSYFEYTYRFRKPTGEELRVSCKASPIRSNGKLLGYMGVVCPIKKD
jgi:PAS domain S-box-containing protein